MGCAPLGPFCRAVGPGDPYRVLRHVLPPTPPPRGSPRTHRDQSTPCSSKQGWGGTDAPPPLFRRSHRSPMLIFLVRLWWFLALMPLRRPLSPHNTAPPRNLADIVHDDVFVIPPLSGPMSNPLLPSAGEGGQVAGTCLCTPAFSPSPRP